MTRSTTRNSRMGPGWSLKNDTSNVAECLSAAGGDVQRHEVIFMLLAHVASQIMAMDGRWLSLSSCSAPFHDSYSPHCFNVSLSVSPLWCALLSIDRV